jgi:hypothetical protein
MAKGLMWERHNGAEQLLANPKLEFYWSFFHLWQEWWKKCVHAVDQFECELSPRFALGTLTKYELPQNISLAITFIHLNRRLSMPIGVDGYI